MDSSMIPQYTKIDYQGSWNIGAYIVATNKYVLASELFRPQVLTEIRRTLRAELYNITISGEDLLGCLLVGNSKGLLAPREIHEVELRHLKKILEGVIIQSLNIRRTYNALGNLIATNDKFFIIQSEIAKQAPKAIELIEDVLDAEPILLETDLTDTVGSYILINNRGAVVSPLFSDEEIDFIRSQLGIPSGRIIVSTINLGNPLIRSGAVANDYGIVVGARTSGVELTRIYNALISMTVE